MVPASSLYLKDDLADVTFVVNSRKKGTCRIPAHTQLICAQSERFRAMFNGNFGKPAKVEVWDAESEDFKSFLRYFYYGSADLTNKNVFPVLYLAQKYLIEDLIKACDHYIDGLTLDATNAIRLFVEAQRCGYVSKKFRSALEKFAGSALESSEFLLLTRTNLREFLRSDKLQASEVAIYARLKAWAEHQLRESHTEQPVTDARIRDCLGDDIWLALYAQMTTKEFSNGPARDDCLSLKEKLDILMYLGGDSNERAQIKERLPLFSTSPRQRHPPRKNSWRDLPLIRTLSHHRVPSRKILGVTIETLVAGDGRNFPRQGQRIRYSSFYDGVETEEEKFGELNGKKFFRGIELAIMAMSIGETAKITISRDLYCNDDRVRRATEGALGFCSIVTLLGIE
ncbi:BTB (POZ) domain containing 6 [Aphelenchoides avenae]|nr:BTB (POZ) domain containing 6 [Aphelenchus avenae]